MNALKTGFVEYFDVQENGHLYFWESILLVDCTNSCTSAAVLCLLSVCRL